LRRCRKIVSDGAYVRFYEAKSGLDTFPSLKDNLCDENKVHKKNKAKVKRKRAAF